MRVIYTGPHPEGVTLYLPDGTVIEAPHGVPVDVDDETAANLLDQGTWTAEQHKTKPAPNQEA